MKKHYAVAMAITLAAGLGLMARAAGETYYYDTDGTNAGFGTAGGDWLAPTPGWTTDGTGNEVPASVTTDTTDALNFGNGGTGLGAGTITVGTVSAGNMTFASGSGAIVLSGGTITLATNETITVNNASNTIHSILAGAGTSLTKAGTGSLTLTGTNTYTGNTLISGGALSLASGRTYSNAGWSQTITITINGGSTVEVGGWGDTATAGLGQVDFSPARILVDNGTIRYVGGFDGGNLDRAFTIGAGGATLEAAAAGTWVISFLAPIEARIKCA